MLGELDRPAGLASQGFIFASLDPVAGGD